MPIYKDNTNNILDLSNLTGNAMTVFRSTPTLNGISLPSNTTSGTTLNTSTFSTLSNRNSLSTTQQLNDIALRLANNQIRQQNKSNNNNNTNGNTFTMFVASDDIVENQKATVTNKIFDINQSSCTVKSGSLAGARTRKKYVWDLVETNNTGSVIATCVYAAKTVSSSYSVSASSDTSNLNVSMSLVGSGSLEAYINYMQYASLLLSSGENTFKIYDSNGNVTDMLSFVAISYNREQYKDKIDPGNITITVNNSKYIDDSGGTTEDPSVNQSYFSYNIISDSGGKQTYGILYPSYGLILLDASVFGKGISGDGINNLYTYKDIVTSDIQTIDISARSAEAITSTYYFIRLKNGMYNYSNNPTFVTGSLGDIKIPLFKESPTTYITTVGLYNNRQELLAVARLSKPISKSFTKEIVLQVKLDF